MLLIEHLRLQGVEGDDALELIDRKAKTPLLHGVTLRGKFISLTTPTKADAERIDAMLESGRAPGCVTDALFMVGTENGRQFATDPESGDAYKKIADAVGVSVTGKKYMSNLCRPGMPGDPEAWVSGRGDVQRICEKRGYGSEGTVKVKMRDRQEAPAPAIPIDPKIVDREWVKELAGQTLPIKEAMDVREKVADRLTPPWKKKKK